MLLLLLLSCSCASARGSITTKKQQQQQAVPLLALLNARSVARLLQQPTMLTLLQVLLSQTG